MHITSDEWLTWDHIARELARAAGVEARIVHVPSDAIAAIDKDWGDGLIGDKANCTIFDNSLIKRLRSRLRLHDAVLGGGPRDRGLLRGAHRGAAGAGGHRRRSSLAARSVPRLTPLVQVLHVSK